jgi:PEP-CTERM motif
MSACLHFFLRRLFMRSRRFSLRSVVAVLSLVASLGFASEAHAQITYGNDLNLGGTYPTTPNYFSFDGTVGGSGGSITPSSLNGYTLPYVYCIDVADNVGVPADYKNSGVSLTGQVVYTINSGHPGTTPIGTTTNGITTLTNANYIAGLLNTYGAAAAGNITKEDALQAAIWTEVYGYDNSQKSGFYVIDSNPQVYNQMLTYLGLPQGTTTVVGTSAPSAAVSSAVWLTPSSDGSPSGLQALVTTVPEPSTFAIAGVGALGFLGYGWKRRKRS